MIGSRRRAATKLHQEAQALERDGRPDEAIALYLRAIELDPHKAESHYNIGLIHKYRGEWRQSFAFNHRAYELDPRDEATRWNLAIAATALRDWPVARRMWADQGIALSGEGPIEADFGVTPVRLHPDGDAEIVWGRRIDPVRVRIENIPFPTSGFRHRDIALHDGASVGSRTVKGRNYAVFNALELFERSDFITYEAELDLVGDGEFAALEALLDQNGGSAEDWTSNVRTLCRQCSEGHPHGDHDRLLERASPTRRIIGIAARPGTAVAELCTDWSSRHGGGLVALRQALA